MFNQLSTFKKLKKLTRDFVHQYLQDPVVSVPVHIVDKCAHTYDEENGDVLPYLTHNKYIVRRNTHGQVVQRHFNGCTRVDIYLDGIVELARKERKDPEVVLHDVLNHMTTRLMDGVDPAWKGVDNKREENDFYGY